MSYDTAHNIQLAIARKHLDSIKNGLDFNHNTLLLVEHKPVYTVGIRDKTPNNEILRLRSLGADFKKTNRGGLVTFHGPGQLVAYPIINLKYYKPSVKWYVNSLEEIGIRLCGDLGIQASRSPHTGVWVADNKIAAIGVHTSRYVTTHGIAINCDIDLSWFKHIDPCGIVDKGVTSLTKETGDLCTIDKITPLFLSKFKDVFECEIEDLDLKSQKDILSYVYNKLMKELMVQNTA